MYWTSDADLIPLIKYSGIEPFTFGYQGFENRMVNKLTNRNDPTRPIFSPSAGAISLFVFASADFNSILSAIDSVLQVISFFTRTEEETPNPQPFSIKGKLKKGIFPIDLKREFDFDTVSISWDLLPPPNNSGDPFPSFVNPPKSFLVHVRTTPRAYNIGYKYRPNGSTEVNQTQTSIYYTKSGPAQVTGSVDLYTPIDDSNIFLEDINSDIEYKYEDIKDTGVTFYYEPSSIGSFLTGNTYTLDIKKEKLPKTYQYKFYGGEGLKQIVADKKEIPTTKLYVEVVSCDTDLGLEDGAIVTNQITLQPNQRPNTLVSSKIKTSTISAKGEINLPAPETSKYIDALKDALAMYLLGGYYQADNAMGLSLKAQKNTKAYLNKLPTDTEILTDVDFKNQVDAKIGSIIDKMNTPDSNVIKALQKHINNLTTPYLVDPKDPTKKITIYNLVGDFGASAYIPGITYDKNSIRELLRSVNKQDLNVNIPDNLPVIYSAESQVNAFDFASTQTAKITKAETARSLIERTINVNNTPIKESAKEFLEFLPIRRPINNKEGAWSNIKLFEDGIPEFEQFIKLILDALQSLSFGLDGIIAAIKQYIDLIILRIEELQVIINKIKRIIDFLLSFKIGGNLALLYTESNGTDGIVEDLLSSSSKPPFKQGETLGFGACFVFGGYPTFLPALLKAFAG
jgi:hypothetical protein